MQGWVQKAKACLELNLVRDVKANKKDFYKHISSKRKTRENAGQLLNGTGVLVTKDIEKANILSTFSPQPLLVRPAFKNPRTM